MQQRIKKASCRHSNINVCRHQIHAFRMMKDSFSRLDRLILNDLCHKIGERYRQVIRPGITQRDRQARLRIRIHEKDFLTLNSQPDTQVFTGGGLARSAFLIGYCRNHGFTRQ